MPTSTVKPKEKTNASFSEYCAYKSVIIPSKFSPMINLLPNPVLLVWSMTKKVFFFTNKLGYWITFEVSVLGLRLFLAPFAVKKKIKTSFLLLIFHRLMDFHKQKRGICHPHKYSCTSPTKHISCCNPCFMFYKAFFHFHCPVLLTLHNYSVEWITLIRSVWAAELVWSGIDFVTARSDAVLTEVDKSWKMFIVDQFSRKSFIAINL